MSKSELVTFYKEFLKKAKNMKSMKLLSILMIGMLACSLCSGCNRQNAVKSAISYFKKNPKAGKVVGGTVRCGYEWCQNRRCNGTGRYWNAWQGCFFRCNMCGGTGR